MKNLQKLFYAFITLSIISVLMTSCEREKIVIEDYEGLETNVVIEDLDGVKDYDEWIQQITEKSKNVEVEYATLSEINEMMIENGLEPFKESELDRAIQLRTNYACCTWEFFGDFNNDNKINGGDLVMAQQYLCNSAANCYNHLITHGHPTEVVYFGIASFLLDNSEASILNRRDVEIFENYILGHIVCSGLTYPDCMD